MLKIGLIGGMSWESSQIYYRLINQRVKEKLGGLHSALCVMESVDLAVISDLQHKGDWNTLDTMMVDCAINLEKAGAQMIVLCTNTMHLSSQAIEESTSIPFIHIAHATGEAIRPSGIEKVLLLGTRFTMEKDFYKKILIDDYGLQVVVPDQEDQTAVHHIIYEELVLGQIHDASRQKCNKIINKSLLQGVEGVILGCTELPLLLCQNDFQVPLFNTTEIHAHFSVDLAMDNEPIT